MQDVHWIFVPYKIFFILFCSLVEVTTDQTPEREIQIDEREVGQNPAGMYDSLNRDK